MLRHRLGEQDRHGVSQVAYIFLVPRSSQTVPIRKRLDSVLTPRPTMPATHQGDRRGPRHQARLDHFRIPLATRPVPPVVPGHMRVTSRP
jgi:hypothetical protein